MFAPLPKYPASVTVEMETRFNDFEDLFLHKCGRFLKRHDVLDMKKKFDSF
ncbi:hypothetical protein NL676_019412, partial [Syzygium grande]